jgi:hypothetical protein
MGAPVLTVGNFSRDYIELSPLLIVEETDLREGLRLLVLQHRGHPSCRP